MTIPAGVRQWLEQRGHGQPTDLTPVAGGCISNGTRLATSQGVTFFLKQNNQAPAAMFEREAEGLRALDVQGGPRLPRVMLVGPNFLLLEDLAPAPQQQDYWPRFGQQLASLHQHHGQHFGFDHDNYLGSTPQPNPATADGHQFFADHRLHYQAYLARERDLLTTAEVGQVERLCRRLEELIPAQPASLIHGDLWSGNAIAGPQGEPALIDPAAHYGWAEAELGMTALFGGFPQDFYRSYQEQRPLTEGWRERLPIYNLYHLLNHLNIFGRSYLSQVQSILTRFGD